MKNNLSKQVGVYRRSDNNYIRKSRFTEVIPIGTMFGLWKVLDNDLLQDFGGGDKKRACRVICTAPSCDTIGVRSYSRLRSGRTTDCGCNLREKLTSIYRELVPLIPVGATFGRWKVIETGLYKNFPDCGQTHRSCRVRCSCGTERELTYGELKDPRWYSCGCKSRERDVESVWNALYKSLKSRKREVHITLPQVKLISQMPCAYCGKKPSNIYRLSYVVGGKRQRYTAPEMEIHYSGIDRVDSTKGYIHGNVVPCCGECNAMKSALPLAGFLALVARIQSHKPSVDGVLHQAATLFQT